MPLDYQGRRGGDPPGVLDGSPASLSPAQNRLSTMLTLSFVKVRSSFIVLGCLVWVLVSACSSDNPPAAAVGFQGGTPHQVGAPCQSGESRACSITLSQGAGTLECYHGLQECDDGRWGACGNGTVSEQAALATPAGLRALALSDAEDCLNNPCNPFCYWYDEEPPLPISAIQEGSTIYDWDAGSLADLPGDVVEQALNQPCGTGAACQFNTRCENPPLDTCAHSVCETGIPLNPSCNECAAMVYEVAQDDPTAYGQCFEAVSDPGAEECVHDPCSTGLALKANCAPAVAEICADSEYAECCSDVWDATCVARLRAENPGICECGVAEVARNGQCLFHIPAWLSWTAARDTCRNHGDGWDLVWVEDASENAFVSDTWASETGDTSWVGFNDQAMDGKWTWSSPALGGVWDAATGSGIYANWCGPKGPPGAPPCPGSAQPPSSVTANCARLTDTGAWVASNCSSIFAPSVCKGPPLNTATTPAPQCESAEEYFVNWGGFETGDLGAIDHAFEAGDYVLTVVAAGEYGVGEWPELQVYIDGVLLDSTSITSVDYRTYSFELTVDTADTLEIILHFSNDRYGGEGNDRNLFVDSFAVGCPGLPPPAGTWGSECIGVAESTCDIRCNEAQPNTGSCVPWLPGETEPSCPDQPDLSLGVPCDGTIPVCNHGQQPAAAGVTLVHMPESAGQFASPAPDLAGGDIVTCITSAAVPPGECISVPESDCNGSVVGTRHVMVNPPGMDVVDECSGLDNWAIAVEDAACDAPLCFGGSTSPTVVRRPVDIIFVIDNSASMQEEIQEVEARINQDFAAIIEDSGLDYRVIMVSRYGDVAQPFGSNGSTSFPICIGPPLGTNACTDPSNEVPVPNERYFHYSAGVGSNDALCLLLDGFSAPDEFGVTNRPGWQVQAPNGFGAWLRPEAFKTFVVITDDNVECTTASNLTFDDGATAAAGTTVANDFDAALRTLAPGQFDDENGARDYVWHSIVNIPENTPAEAPWPPDAPILSDLCIAEPVDYVGPGTGYQALSLLTGGVRYPSCRTSDFDAVFTAIAEEVIDQSELTCTFDVSGSDIDFEDARVAYTTGDDEHIAVSEVSDASSCDAGGWYLDASGDVPSVNLCPATCQAVQADANAQLFVEFACQVFLEVATETQIYEASCPMGTIVEWRALGYDTTIEGDGSVEFRVRTAVTEAELPDVTYQLVNTALEANPDCVYLDSMTCVPDDTDCNCVEIEGQPEGIAGGVVLGGEVLDTTESHHQYLELQITVLPDLIEMTSPLVNAWKVAYSCLPGE